MIQQTNIILGLDFGTCNTSIVEIKNNKYISLIDNDQIPSLIFINNKKILFGNMIDHSLYQSKYLISNIKRLIGSKWDNPDTQKIIKKFNYKVKKDKDSNYLLIETPRGDYRPIDLIKLFLSYLYRIIKKKYTSEKFSIIATIPAYFNDFQRKLLSTIIKKIGFNLIRLINEPSAAAFFYGLTEKNDTSVLVYDLGGGTLDVSLLEKDEGLLEVIGTRGNCFLGGDDFTNILVKNILYKFKKKNEITDSEISVNKSKLIELKNKCEKIKIRLTTEKKVSLEIENFWENKDLEQVITNRDFEKWSTKLTALCMKPIKLLLDDIDYTNSNIDNIILIGGASLMPFIKFEIYKLLGTFPNIYAEHSAVVAKGAALYASKLLGTKTENDIILIDVLPLSLCIETNEGGASTIIKRNTPLPTIGKKRYTTVNDETTSIDIKIYEGERKIANKNMLIGEFNLTGITKSPKGIPIIEIEIKVDVNGIIHISAEEIKGHVKNAILINNKSNKMSNQDIDKLIKESVKYEENEMEHTLYLEKSWELRDLLSIIRTNLSNYQKIKNKNKKIIIDELDNINSTYSNYHSSKILSIINNLKKKYSTLLTNISDDFYEKKKWVEIDKTYNSKDILKARRNICSKLKNYISLVDPSNLSIKSYLNQVLEWCQYDGLTLTQLDEKLNQIEEVWNEYNGHIDYKNELFNLCLFLQNEIENNNLEISSINSKKLNNEINKNIKNIEIFDSKEDIFWKNQIDLLNNFCEKII